MQTCVSVSNAPQCLADETLFAFVLGQLAPKSLAEVERHLSECNECRSVVAETAQSLTAPEPAHPNGDGMPRIGRYDLLGLLGAGAYGVVYRAFDPDLRRTVALKVLRPDEHSHDSERRARMAREAQAMAQLSHPNVVAVYDVGLHADTIYIVMEYVAGGTARDFVTARHRSATEVLDVYLQAGLGLAAAHEKGLVHRDFKPENVLVGVDGQVRVTDFGLARIMGAGQGGAEFPGPEQAVELSATRGLIGTPGYVAPEQYSGALADAQSDQFSFCVALFAALYGRHPFRAGAGVTLEELAVRVRSGAVLEIPESERIAGVHCLLLQGLLPDPRARQASMTALLSALQRASLPRVAARRGLVVALLFAGVLALGLLVWRVRTPSVVMLRPNRLTPSTVSAPSAVAGPSAAPVLSASSDGSANATSSVTLDPRVRVKSRGNSATPRTNPPRPRERRYVDGLKEPF